MIDISKHKAYTTIMGQTSAGGKLAAAKIKEKYGNDHYAKIGHTGGQRGHTGGFYKNTELARRAGAAGGKISRRKPASHCSQGHAYTADNIYSCITSLGTRTRKCKTCARGRQKRADMREASTNA